MSARYFLTPLGYLRTVPHPGGGIVRTCRHCGRHASACPKTRALWLEIDAQAELAEQLHLDRNERAA